MRQTILLLYFLLSLPLVLWGSDQKDDPCAPVKNGKVCYSDDVEVENMSQSRLFDVISQWAVKTYGTDVFYSNVSSNKSRGTILVSSKVELLLNEKEKTFLKYRMRIHCYAQRYTIEITDIVYQYDPHDDKRFKTYPAENVILNEGRGNVVDIIRDPLLFCKATHFFAEGLIRDIYDQVKKSKR